MKISEPVLGLLLMGGIVALAATPMVAPRGNGEGSLGGATQRWGAVYGVTGEFSRVTMGGTNVMLEGSYTSATYAVYATSAGTASNATYATSAGTASNATYATGAGTAANATNAEYAVSAGTAAVATNAAAGGNIVTNGGITINGVALGNGTNLTTSGVDAGTASNIAGTVASTSFVAYATSAGTAANSSNLNGVAGSSFLTNDQSNVTLRDGILLAGTNTAYIVSKSSNSVNGILMGAGSGGEGYVWAFDEVDMFMRGRNFYFYQYALGGIAQFDSSGRFGLNGTPTATLDVNGSAIVRTNLTVSGAITSAVMGCTAFNLDGTNAVRAAQNGAAMPAGGLVVTGGVLSAGNAIYYSQGAVAGTVTGYVAAATGGATTTLFENIQFTFNGGGGLPEVNTIAAGPTLPYGFTISNWIVRTDATNCYATVTILTNGACAVCPSGNYPTLSIGLAARSNALMSSWAVTNIPAGTDVDAQLLGVTNATWVKVVLQGWRSGP